MNAAMIPYSIDVAPRSSRQNVHLKLLPAIFAVLLPDQAAPVARHIPAHGNSNNLT
jgi:hypothetical protein